MNAAKQSHSNEPENGKLHLARFDIGQMDHRADFAQAERNTEQG